MAIGLSALYGCSAPQPTPDIADTVYTNGAIYTVDSERPWAAAVAISDGRFLVVRSAAEVEAGKFADMIVIDQNILEIPVSDIYKTHVLTTVVGGEVVYELE